MPLIEKREDKINFEEEYRLRTVPALELIEVEELTRGMSAGEIPEWARWTILFVALSFPALLGIKKYTSLLEKIKPKSKRKKDREKEKKKKNKKEKQTQKEIEEGR